MKKQNFGTISPTARMSISAEAVKLKNSWYLFVRQTSVIEPEDTIRTALKIMAHKGFRHLPVVKRDRDKELLGMISAQDLIELIAQSYNLPGEGSDNGNHLLSRLDESASTIMNDNPVTITRDETIFDAIEIMSKKNIGALPIQEGTHETRQASKESTPSLIGIITLRDVISILGAFAPFGVRVEDYMTQDVFSIHEADTIYSAASLMSKRKVRRLPVISSKGWSHFGGMITNKMIIRLVESCASYRNLGFGMEAAARQFVRASAIQMPLIDPREDCGTAAYMMRELGTGGFAVADSRGLLGVITERDLIKRICDREGISFFSDLLSAKAPSIYI
jgi:CBS domain-containing protein